MTGSSSAIPSAAVKIFWTWILFIKSVSRICASLKMAVTTYFAAPSLSSPDSASMQAAASQSGGMKLFAVRLYWNVVPPK